MARPQGSRNKPKIAYRCEECGEAGFAVKKCPECGSTHVLELNKSGIPITDMQSAIGAQPDMPMVLGSAPEFMDPAAELRRVAAEAKLQTIEEMTLDNVKAKAAEARANRIRAEEELNLTKQGFRKPDAEQADQMMVQQPQRTVGMDPAALLNGLSGWTADARQDFFDRLTNEDDFALKFSQAFQQHQMQMDPQQMMNPWMNPMMMGQQQAPPQEQESAASMMTAVIAAVAQIQELSGGRGNDNAALDRLMDKMERMEERNAEQANAMQQRIADLQQLQGSHDKISIDDVQRMIHATIANSSTDQLSASIESINGVVTGLQSLGIVQRRDDTASSKEDFEEKKWNKEFDLKKSEQEYNRKRDDESSARQAEIELAKQATTQGMLKMMVDVNRESISEVAKEEDEEKPESNTVRSVIS